MVSDIAASYFVNSFIKILLNKLLEILQHLYIFIMHYISKGDTYIMTHLSLFYVH